MNKRSLKFFEEIAAITYDISSVKLANKSDFTRLDADFILKYANKESKILDLGSGTGLIINKIYKEVKKIVAVEYFPEFSKFIEKSDNIKVVNVDIFKYSTEEKFDLLTLFAVMHYLNEREAIEIYSKYISFVTPGGKILVKNQFGINEDVEVSGYSEEQKNNYYAQYRHIDKEIRILSDLGCRNIEVVDIYPPECNRWSNTHFYAIAAEV
ncbi:MAG: class I SAM-dependent methyltransferase [Holosporaceae bacterium]|jgi:SAM-dependent methyltransferase|nr:class I SAM-dependent methyltransferase [Holosporaceae bacterium]